MSTSSLPTVNGKSVLVTGASSGIGQACAVELAGRGYHVFAGVRNPEAAREINAVSENVTAVTLDVTHPDAIETVAELIREKTGVSGLTGLVNNAGYVFACPLEFAPLDQFRRQFEVNVTGQLAVTQAMLPMLRQAGGRIININSISGHLASPYVGPYAASKHAFAAISDSWRLELRNLGVKVVQIIPGDIETPIWKKSREFANQLREQMAEDIKRRLPPEVTERYAEDGEAIREATASFADQALPVSRVVAAVMAGLTAKRPKSHYIVGARTWGAVQLLSKMPRSWRDWIVLKTLGLKR